MPVSATLHGVPAPHYLQYILYMASGESQLASITTTWNYDTGEVSRASSITVVNLPANRATLKWSVDNNMVCFSDQFLFDVSFLFHYRKGFITYEKGNILKSTLCS